MDDEPKVDGMEVISEYFGTGGITRDHKSVKFWVGPPEPDMDSDIYLDASDFRRIAAAATRCAASLDAISATQPAPAAANGEAGE